MESATDFRDTPLALLIAGLSGIGVGALLLMLAGYFIALIASLIFLAFIIWVFAMMMSS